jgi:hypothetical protein
MIPGAAIAMRDAIESIRKGAITEMERRGKVATGRTMSTLSTFVTVDTSTVTGELQGEEQWRFVGNGRRPGKMPPIAPIQAWIDAKGFSISAWAVAKSIAQRGSKDWRNKAPNVFLSAMDDFEKDGLAKLESEVAGYFENQVVDVVVNNFKR